MKPKKYIFITGGVVSSLGKGLTASAIGALLESRGLKITMQKLDPYLNVDPGTMNPFQHGEVFVTEDGAETDLDLGHYERFTHAQIGRRNNFTAGQIYDAVLTKERKGEYLGHTVQVIPHITDEIKEKIRAVSQDADLAIVEVGGTVGDIEGLPFFEAIRQFRSDAGPENTLYIHLTLVPFIAAAGELKTKPTQHSVAALRQIGIQPDIIICRTDRLLPVEIKRKIALFCNTAKDAVITAKDVETIYELPLILHQEGLDNKIVELLNIWTATPNLAAWEEIVHRIKHPSETARIALVGKYVDLTESYKSLNEALIHGGLANDCRVEIDYVDSEELLSAGIGRLEGVDGILVPGGFGKRGAEGKIAAIRYARERGIPFFGICLGMQLAVVEFARNVLGLTRANSAEMDPDCEDRVIDLMPEQLKTIYKGATMRLGAYPCLLEPDTLARKIYGTDRVSERHRHRYEVNNAYRSAFRESTLVCSGLSEDGMLVEMIELSDHPWFIGCQFHPEFKSRPMQPHPLFRSFIAAALREKERRAEERTGVS